MLYLEGLDTIWRVANGLKQEYWFLSPRNYRFSLRASLNKQNVSNIATIELSIATPWSQRPINIVGMIILGVFTIFGGIYWRSIQLINTAKEKSKIEEQIIQLRLQALQSQMSPHFIFNALGAIQDYIFEENAEQANKYLVKFSRLMRLILESSRKKVILLSEELKLIELYVSLEQLRFTNRFNYCLNITSSIDETTTYIPSMLIQPFIENAINHGLYHKESGNGELELKIDKIDKNLIIEVIDNGVGLQRAREIKKQFTKNELSRALEIVRERTSLYNKTSKDDIELFIEEIFNEQKIVVGTKVRLVLDTFYIN